MAGTRDGAEPQVAARLGAGAVTGVQAAKPRDAGGASELGFRTGWRADKVPVPESQRAERAEADGAVGQGRTGGGAGTIEGVVGPRGWAGVPGAQGRSGGQVLGRRP